MGPRWRRRQPPGAEHDGGRRTARRLPSEGRRAPGPGPDSDSEKLDGPGAVAPLNPDSDSDLFRVRGSTLGVVGLFGDDTTKVRLRVVEVLAVSSPKIPLRRVVGFLATISPEVRLRAVGFL